RRRRPTHPRRRRGRDRRRRARLPIPPLDRARTNDRVCCSSLIALRRTAAMGHDSDGLIEIMAERVRSVSDRGKRRGLLPMARWFRSVSEALGATVVVALGIAGAVWLVGGDVPLPGLAGSAHAAAPPETPEQQVTLAWRDDDGQTRAGTIAKDKLVAFAARQS